ncbi:MULTISPECIES: Gfo/Idh/MocA family oxidoreductase [Ignavibacterium]|jgi:UDP-N-acetyl-2-amino-2-deoxyglucuronate dehydrogenase|uniref:Gfo/Idh/MocA family oxidoreductase n=1 Tax=Ignavibacterium TaxID=795750 RepID=UPI0025C4BD75|nr:MULTISPECIES: Gfo/Idh/MocA family oxidoreductase [Ignavibacterium]
MKNFAMTGVGGYIAPRHLQAIKDTGNRLVAAMDPNDSVGIIDRYFPNASFFTEFERFDRHLEKLRRTNSPEKVDYISICSPNNLHDAHIRLALRIGADAICEKPLVLNPWNLDALEELELESGKKVFTILQLRVHPSLLKLKKEIDEKLKTQPNIKFDVALDYITARGVWYDFSWKGIKEKSGGVATNIGVHFFDLLIWLFGKPLHSQVIDSRTRSVKGFLELEHAYVNWFLSINFDDLPEEIKRTNSINSDKQITTYRSIRIDGNEIEFTEGFTNLHTVVYQETLAGRGFGIKDARPAIELVYKIRNEINF